MPNTKKQPLPDIYYKIVNSTEMDDGLREKVLMSNTTDFTDMSYLEMMDSKLLLQSQNQEDKKFKGQTATFISGTSTSKWQQIEQISNQLDDGPYHMGGRDNKLTVHPSKAAGAILFSYEFMGGDGELLNFEVDTDFTMTISEVTQTSTISPEDKNMKIETNQVIPNTDAMYQDGEVKVHTRKPLMSNAFYKFGGSMPQDNIPIFHAKTALPPTLIRRPDTKPGLIPEEGIFASVDEAKEKINRTYEPNQKDVLKYQETIRQYYRKIENPTTEQEFKEQISSNKLPPFNITRRVVIESKHSPSEFTQRNRDWNKPANERRGAIHDMQTEQGRKNARREGMEFLKKAREYTVIEIEGSNDVILRRIIEVEVPVPGVRMLAAYSSNMSTQGAINDMVRSVQNKITSNAQIIGNTKLESSMNVEIKNVSERYSGVWYTKEVTHNISSSGYTCDIEFIQKSLPVSISQVKGIIPTTKVYDDWVGLSEEAKKSLETGTHMARVSLEMAFKEWKRENNLDGQFLIISRPDDPFTGDVYNATQDMRKQSVEPVATLKAPPIKED